MNQCARRFYRYAAGLIPAFCLLLLAGCGRQQSAPGPVAGPQLIPVKVVTVAPRDIEEDIEYVANVKAQEEVQVFPRVSGKIMEKVRQEGDRVAKNEPIIFIDRDETGLTFEKAPVQSPLAGIVGRVLVDVGSHVSAQTPVAVVVDMDRVRVYLDVPEKYLPRIAPGMPAAVSVEAYGERTFPGQVEKISPMVDTATRTAQAQIGIDNPEHLLRSGMYAKVRLSLNRYKDAIAVLKEAVLGREPHQYVYVVRDGKAEVKDIATGVRQGPYVQVVKGLLAGDKVVIMGQQRLYAGAAVLAEENGQ